MTIELRILILNMEGEPITWAQYISTSESPLFQKIQHFICWHNKISTLGNFARKHTSPQHLQLNISILTKRILKFWTGCYSLPTNFVIKQNAKFN